MTGLVDGVGDDRVLVGRVRPGDWVNPEARGRYNLVVLGAGTGGLVVAAGAAGLGARVALVEKGLLGGDCLNVGCVPSKALLRAARVAGVVRRGGELGVRVGTVEVDFGRVMERMRRLRAEISRHDSVERFAGLGVDVFLGVGRFTGKDRLVVDGKELRFARACVATGSRPVVPPIEGLEEAGFLTNETLFGLTELPGRLAVIGGGPIGCEMAQAFAAFGARVTLVERGKRILAQDDEDAAAIIAQSLGKDGVDLRLQTNLAGVVAGKGSKKLILEKKGNQETLEVDKILVAVGRAPSVEGLGLEAAGVEADPRRGVVVDDWLRTSNRRIYAAGDVCLKEKFTHTADAAARCVIRNALFFGRRKKSALTIPWCTYTHPELAHVGMSEDEARERGVRTRTQEVRLEDVDRAVLDGETEGFFRILVEEGKGRVLGATIVAPDAGNLISEVTLAMLAGMKLSEISDVIHPYPTVAEALRKAGDLENKERLTPRVKTMLAKLMAWRR